MSTLSLRLPDSLHVKVKELAERDEISINQFIATAVAEKMAALLTVEYLRERAARGRHAEIDGVLRKVPARAPLAGDEMPEPLEADKQLRPARAPKKKRSTKPRSRRPPG